MSGRRVLLIGAGGHARVVIDAFGAAAGAGRSQDTVVACVDDDAAKHGTDVMGVPVVGTVGSEVGDPSSVLVAVGSAGDARHRARLFDTAVATGLELASVVHPMATVSVECRVGAGSTILAGAVVQVGARIGKNVIVNTGAVVEHDAAIGAHSHVSPRAVVLGNARVGESCHVGAGAVVLQGVDVGDGAVIGAGAVVTRDVEPGVLVVGVPARVVRTEPR
ncbi:MAG: acetyltransferase [Planctomycetota bacterium]